MSQNEVKTWHFDAADGVQIAVHEMAPTSGEGRPLILIHGYFSEADTNWIKYGHAALLAEAGFRVIMPDLRGHGDSGKPHDSKYYTRDVLADDQFALIEHMGLTDFDLGGYSLGGRTVARMLARRCEPRRAVISGMGLKGLIDTEARGDHFRHVLTNLGQHERGSPAFMAEAFLKTSGGDPVALLHILDTFVDTPVEAIGGMNLSVGVVCGEDDSDNGSASDLADALPHGTLISIPGNHMSAVVKPDLGQAICDYLLGE